MNFLNKKCGVKVLTLANLMNALFGFSFTFIIAHLVGLKGFGEFTLYQGGLAILCSIFNFKLWEPLIFSLTKSFSFFKIKTCFILEILISIFGLFISVLIILFSYYFNLFDLNLSLAILMMFNILPMSFNTFNAYIRHTEKYNIVLLSSFFCGLFKVMASLFFAKNILDISVILLISECIRFSIAMWSLNIHKVLFNNSFNKRFCLLLFSKAHRLNTTSIIDIPVNYLDRYVINYFFGNELTGIFTLCRRIGQFFVIVINSYYQHCYTKIISRCKDDLEKAIAYCFNLIVRINIIFLLGSVFFYLFVLLIPINIEQFYLLKKYNFFVSIMLYSICFCCSLNLVHPVFLYKNGYKKIIQYTVLANLVYSVALFYGVSYISLYGGVIALCIQSITLITLKMIYIKRG